jgi:hypothetical protein
LVERTRLHPPHETLDVVEVLRRYVVLVGPQSRPALMKSVVPQRSLGSGIASCLACRSSVSSTAPGVGVGEHTVMCCVVGVAACVEAVMIIAGQCMIGLVLTSTSAQPLQSTWSYTVAVDGYSVWVPSNEHCGQ